MRVSNFGQKLDCKMVLRLVRGSTYTRVYTVSIANKNYKTRFIVPKCFIVRNVLARLHCFECIIIFYPHHFLTKILAQLRKRLSTPPISNS
jgi:hypothetical protein